MKLSYLISASLTLFLLNACGGLNQDPLAGKPTEVRNPKGPYNGKVVPVVTKTTDVLSIDGKDFYSFKEGTRGQAKFDGQVLLPISGSPQPKLGREFDLAVENLPDFPGATFDRATGLFEWTPPLNFVTNEMSRQVTLTVFMQTMKGPRLSLRKSFNVFVTRVESDPEIVAVEAIPLSREGEIKNFHVTVKDPDSSSAANGSTKIVYNQCTSGLDIGSRVSIVGAPVQVGGTSDTWAFTLRLDLNGRVVNQSEELRSFGLLAVSRYGHNSSPASAEVRVRALLSPPLETLSASQIPAFIVGRENTTSFTVADVRGFGNPRVVFTKCESGANCNCITPSAAQRSHTYLHYYLETQCGWLL